MVEERSHDPQAVLLEAVEAGMVSQQLAKVGGVAIRNTTKAIEFPEQSPRFGLGTTIQNFCSAALQKAERPPAVEPRPRLWSIIKIIYQFRDKRAIPKRIAFFIICV